ncbi:unnamed protein product [Danaus chrysippus]|uniref:(African queen) hypothetical protein n=1 Tax=Danaus chrysippus TaxID=151541 RepID=A0A8J2QDC6_9NEOP|nr:unnamed protein product [Danaus chrysippus]
MFLLVLFLIIVTTIILYRAVCRRHNSICKSRKKLKGQTTVITGGTAGIGQEIALDFAARGARVIIASPFEDEGIKARNRIIRKSGNEDVVYKFLDLASLKSVRKFAADINESEKELHILVNNAGIGIPGEVQTDDGMNLVLQVNYYGHFLLTLLLLPLLIKSGTKLEPSRIINMSSITRFIGSFDIDNYNRTKYWNSFKTYCNSKLSLVLFSHELTKKIADRNVVINCADPGCVSTKIFKSYFPYAGKMCQVVIKIFFKSAWEGAQTAVYMAVDQKAGEVSGQVFNNCELTSPLTWNDIDKYSEMLWKQSAELVFKDEKEISRLLPKD